MTGAGQRYVSETGLPMLKLVQICVSNVLHELETPPAKLFQLGQVIAR
jgi:hypothetical protein